MMAPPSTYHSPPATSAIGSKPNSIQRTRSRRDAGSFRFSLLMSSPHEAGADGWFFASGASSRSGKIFLTTASAIAAFSRGNRRSLLDGLPQILLGDRKLGDDLLDAFARHTGKRGGHH